jgi:hypothetical protein
MAVKVFITWILGKVRDYMSDAPLGAPIYDRLLA